MSKRVPKSVRQTVHNLLTVLAQQGDLDAMAALGNSQNFLAEEGTLEDGTPLDEESDAEEAPPSSVKVILECPDGMYVVSPYGTSFLEGGKFLPEGFGEPGFEWPE